MHLIADRLARAIELAERLMERDVGRGEEVHSLLAPIYDGFAEGHELSDLLAARSLLDESAP